MYLTQIDDVMFFHYFLDIEEVGFLKDAHGRYIYKRDFLLRYQSQSIPPPSSLEETDIFCPG